MLRFIICFGLSTMLGFLGCSNRRPVDVTAVAATPADADSPHRDEPSQTVGRRGDTLRSNVFRVALDIGHLPSAGGAVAADGKMEYEFNKRIVELIAADLETEPGIRGIVVNPEGKRISLPARAAVANAANADLFLAIHHDSANDKYLEEHESNGRIYRQTKRFHGYSVFFSEKNREPARSLQFAEALGEAMHNASFTPTAHHAEKIAGENRQLVEPTIGVYRFDDLVVLKRAAMPAALLECGVIVNPVEEAELLTPERQRKTVAAVRHAVIAMRDAAIAQPSSSAGPTRSPLP